METIKIQYKGLRLDKIEVYMSSESLKLNSMLEEKID